MSSSQKEQPKTKTNNIDIRMHGRCRLFLPLHDTDLSFEHFAEPFGVQRNALLLHNMIRLR